MQQLYKALTAVLAFTGCASLIISGEVNPVLALTGLGLFPGYYRLLKGMPPAPKWAIGGLSVVVVFVYLCDALIISNDYFLAVAHLTIAFQAIKSFDLKEPWDYLQVYFMALLQIIIASELIYSIIFGVIFVLFLITLVAAMVFSHFMREGKRLKITIGRPVAVTSVLTLLITAILFVFIPRWSGSLWGKSHLKSIKTVGFSQRVDFGSFGDVIEDPTIVMRVEVEGDSRIPFYWRGITLDQFNGISWKNTLAEKTWIYRRHGRFTIRPAKDEKIIVQGIFLEPMDNDVIFGLGDIATVESRGTIMFMDEAGALFLPEKRGKRFNYFVYSLNDLPHVYGYVNEYLQMPSGFKRTRELAKNIARGIDRDIDKAEEIEKFLRKNYKYSLSVSPPPEGVNPIEDFLFHSKRGYCEHYATSMVLMLRSIGIPSRIVTGFAGGELNEYGGYIIVRQSNAHSWVEAAINGVWMTFDPTPPVIMKRPPAFTLFIDMLRMKWNRYIVAFSSYDQREILRVFSSSLKLPAMPGWRLKRAYKILFILMPLSVIILTVFLLRRLRFMRYGFVTAQYLKLRNAVRNKGARVTASSTPSDVRTEAARIGVDAGLEEFLRLYEDCRFGGNKMDGERLGKYQDLFSGIKRKIRQL